MCDNRVPDKDLISRQAAITIPILPKEHRKYQTMNLDDAYELGWFDCQKCIEDLPSASPDLSGYSDRLWKLAYERGKASVQPRRGLWIDIKHTFMTKCSVCDWINNDDSSYNFCPRCGADMRVDSDEKD